MVVFLVAKTAVVPEVFTPVSAVVLSAVLAVAPLVFTVLEVAVLLIAGEVVFAGEFAGEFGVVLVPLDEDPATVVVPVFGVTIVVPEELEPVFGIDILPLLDGVGLLNIGT